MSVILYARVSDPRQAEKELSIPSQIRTLKRLCSERGWVVAGVYTDVSTAATTALRSRPGLLAAINRACRDREVDAFFVHRLDRFARNLFTHLTLKGKLEQHGVRLVSAVENCDSSPMGQFIERIMAAQAEFYSANLGLQIKAGIEERLLRGEWHSSPPIGYIKEHGRVLIDPARGHFIKLGFERWSTGEVNSRELADELHQAGLVSRHGKRLSASKICEFLHNPFYIGQMILSGRTYAGTHPPLISRELFERCQEVFRQKHSGGQPRRHLHFLLSRKLVCPRCVGFLVGEEHEKKSGKVYRYYRCHRQGCGFIIRADELEHQVKAELVTQLGKKRAEIAVLTGSDPVEAKRVFDAEVLKVELESSGRPRVMLHSVTTLFEYPK